MTRAKRGISPLIASVLLIGFTVALAAIVMTWGIDFIGNIQERTEQDTASALLCASDLNFDITSVQCDANGKSMRIINKGSIPINSFIILFKHATGSNTMDTSVYSDGALPQGANLFEETTLNHPDIQSALTPGVYEVEVRARITPKQGAESKICTSNIKTWDVNPPCI